MVRRLAAVKQRRCYIEIFKLIVEHNVAWESALPDKIGAAFLKKTFFLKKPSACIALVFFACLRPGAPFVATQLC
jgi:hypothetical protein